MASLVLTTFDRVPEAPRGYARDLRVRWALEEAELPYRVESVPFGTRTAEHLAHQPFGQVPWLTDGGMSIFESGAILLYLGERSGKLIPAPAIAASRRRVKLLAATGPLTGTAVFPVAPKRVHSAARSPAANHRQEWCFRSAGPLGCPCARA